MRVLSHQRIVTENDYSCKREPATSEQHAKRFTCNVSKLNKYLYVVECSMDSPRSVVVGPVLGAVVVRAGIGLRGRVAGVRVLLLLRVHCARKRQISYYV